MLNTDQSEDVYYFSIKSALTETPAARPFLMYYHFYSISLHRDLYGKRAT